MGMIWKVRNLLIVAVIVILFLIGTARADVLVKDYPSEKGKQTMALYIGGIGQGISQVNTHLYVDNRPRLYCPPGNLAIHAEQYVSILEQELEHSQTVYQKIPDAPVSMALLSGLIRTFPCQEGEQRK